MWESIGVIVGTISASIALSITLYKITKKRLWHPSYKWVSKLNNAIEELTPNGGNSLKDNVTKISSELAWVNARVKLQMNNNNIPLYECDIEGNCIFANTALCNLFGLDRSEMLGNGWLRSVAEKDKIRVFNHWRECIKKGIPYETYYGVINSRTKKSFDIITKAYPLKDSNNEIIAYAGFLESIKLIEEDDSV